MPSSPAPAAGNVVVLTGPPGAGKSTVAALLVETFPKGVLLVADSFWEAIRTGRVAPFLPEAHRQNQVVMAALAAAAVRYAQGGYTVVLDGIVGPWFLNVVTSAASRTGVAVHYAVLRPDEPTALARATSRAGEALTHPDPVHDLYRQFSDLGEHEGRVVDSTDRTPAETCHLVRDLLETGHFRLD